MFRRLRRKMFFMMVAMFVILVAVNSAVNASYWQLSVSVEGVTVEGDVDPYINEDGRTMVPIRFVSEALGFDVDWNHNARRVTITGKDSYGEYQELRLVIGEMLVRRQRGDDVEMDTVPVIKDGRTMVPVRFISEAMGMQVVWEPERKIVGVTARPFEEGNDIHRDELFERGLDGFFRQTKRGLWWEKNPDQLMLGKGSALTDLLIAMREPTLEVRREVKELLKFFFPTGYEDLYNKMMKVARQELWDFEVDGCPHFRTVSDNRTISIALAKGRGLIIRIGTFGTTRFTETVEGFDYSVFKEHTFKTERELENYIEKYDLYTY